MYERHGIVFLNNNNATRNYAYKDCLKVGKTLNFQKVVFSCSNCPLKMMKNIFYFMLKFFFVFKVFNPFMHNVEKWPNIL